MNNRNKGDSVEQRTNHDFLPRLRFPEFLGAEAWTFQPLENLAKRSTRKNKNGVLTRVLTNSAEHGVVDQREFFDQDIANHGNLDGYYIVELGAYVYNPRISANAPVGPISKNKLGVGVMSPLYTVFNFNNSSNDFYAHYFKSTHWHHYMRQSSSTGARHDRMSITNDAFMRLPLPVPMPMEQQKIADCLSSLDDLISAITRKLAQLRAYKKGLLQQVFPAKNEALPNFRFPEFRGKAIWKKRTLADILQEHGKKSTGREEVYSVSVHKGLVNQVEHLGRSFSASSTAHYNRVIPGDVVYTKSPTGDFPLGVIKQSKLDFDVIVSPLYGVFSPETKALGALLDAYFDSPETAFAYLEPLAQKGAKNTININNARFLSGSLSFPVEEAEQKRIADFLGSTDELISAVTQRLVAVKALKKGLMQQLFPRVDGLIYD